MPKLSNFQINTTRDLLVPDVYMYQMNLAPVVQYVQEKLSKDVFDNEAPSFTKAAADPEKARPFWHAMAQTMFHSRNNIKSVQTNRAWKSEEFRVCMMFVSASIEKENLDVLGTILQDSLDGWYVAPLHGDAQDAVGKAGMKNFTVETQAKEFLLDAKRKKIKSVLFVAAHMAQRSFSVGEITELYLAYDSGDEGATIQKMSRALTPNGSESKVARIVSMSFDPNRDDKFDPFLLEAIKNKIDEGVAPQVAARIVLDTLDIFSMEDTPIKIDYNTYLSQMLESSRLVKAVGRSSDTTKLPHKLLMELANFKLGKKGLEPRVAKGRAFERGTVAVKLNRKKKDDPHKQAREVLMFMIEHMDFFMVGTKSRTVDAMLEVFDTNESYQQYLEQNLGIEYRLFRDAMSCGAINKTLMELIHR